MGGGLTVVAIIFIVLRDPRKSDKMKAGGDSGAQQARRQVSSVIISLYSAFVRSVAHISRLRLAHGSASPSASFPSHSFMVERPLIGGSLRFN